jgi:hypothetical protein
VAIFLALVLGMACGTQRYLTAVVGSATLLAVMAFLWWTSFGSFGRFDGYVTLRLAEAGGNSERLLGVLRGFCRSTKQVSLHEGAAEVEYVFQVGMRDRKKAQELVAALRGVEGVKEASLVLRDEMAEV